MWGCCHDLAQRCWESRLIPPSWATHSNVHWFIELRHWVWFNCWQMYSSLFTTSYHLPSLHLCANSSVLLCWFTESQLTVLHQHQLSHFYLPDLPHSHLSRCWLHQAICVNLLHPQSNIMSSVTQCMHIRWMDAENISKVLVDSLNTEHRGEGIVCLLTGQINQYLVMSFSGWNPNLSCSGLASAWTHFSSEMRESTVWQHIASRDSSSHLVSSHTTLHQLCISHCCHTLTLFDATCTKKFNLTQ